jgi:hypothetical protein
MTLLGSICKSELDIPVLDLEGGIARFLINRSAILRNKDVNDDDQVSALRDVDLFVDGIFPQDGDTQMLVQILSRIWHNERNSGSSESCLVYGLQQKYALFGRLSGFYNGNLHKVGDQQASMEELALFAAILLLRYLKFASLNELNSAIKVIDGILISEPADSPLLNAALILEQTALKRLLA